MPGGGGGGRALSALDAYRPQNGFDGWAGGQTAYRPLAVLFQSVH